MLGSFRLAAGSLFLIFVILGLTAIAQTPEGKNTLPPGKSPEDAAKINVSSAIKPNSNEITGANNPTADSEKKNVAGLPEKENEEDKNRALNDDEDDAGLIGSSEGENRASSFPGRYRAKRGFREYNFEPGIAPTDPTHYTGEKTYNTSGRKLGTTHFRVGHVLGTTKAITVTYFYGFTPLIVARANEVKNPSFVSPTETPGVSRTIRRTTYGVGFQPAQFRFTFFPKSRLKPFVQAGAGVLFFDKPVPIPESRRMQFSGEYGGGFILHQNERRDRFMTFGYRYYHISNANIGGKQWNPGYNANVFYIGYSFFR